MWTPENATLQAALTQLPRSELNDELGKLAPLPAPEVSGARKVPRTLQAMEPFVTAQFGTVHNWAVQAGVDPHTAQAYLDGRRDPYEETLIKLGKPLGLDKGEMPRRIKLEKQ